MKRNIDNILKPIRTLKTSYLDNFIVFIKKSSKYIIVNDEYSGIIVLDHEWKKVRQFYIGEDLVVADVIYVDTERNRFVLVLEKNFCFIDIDKNFVKLISILDNIDTHNFTDLHQFHEHYILMGSDKAILRLSFTDFTVELVNERLLEDTNIYFLYKMRENKESYFYNNQLICLNSNYITIFNHCDSYKVRNVISISYFDVMVVNQFCVAIAEKQLQLIHLGNDLKSKFITFNPPYYGTRAVFFECDRELHLILLRWNDLESFTYIEEYILDFASLPNTVVI